LLSVVEQLLTIGEFAQRCGLSRSALRFYDQNGLLRPRLVDDVTGYRHYAIGQLEQALLVRRLRNAEMPVGVLREFLVASPEHRHALLEEHVASFRERASAVESVVGQLRDDLERAADEDRARWCSVSPEELAGALQQVSFAVANPAVRAELGAVWVETKDDSLRLVATDSYRLAVRDLLPERMGSAGIRGTIDGPRAERLAAELAHVSTLVISQGADGVIEVSLDGRASVVGGPGDGFPAYERILSGLPTGHQIALARDDLEHALSGLPADAPHLSLRFEPDLVALEALGHRALVSGTWSGPALTVFVDCRFFAEAVRATVGPDVIVEAVDPLEPITLRSADTGTFSVLTMPIRPPDSA
jgi:DNA-binding transcriptional MerR regulator